MGILSSGRKNDAQRRRSVRGARNLQGAEGRVERRTRRQANAGVPDNDAEAMLLDPTLPEKQRARRRLVGALVLVVATVLILPLLLDSHPKPVTSDIAIDIPSHVASAVSPSQANVDVAAAPGNPASAAGASESVAAVAATTPDTQAQTAAPTVPATSPSSARNAQTVSSPAPANRSTAANANASGDNGDMSAATTPGAHFAVQFGTFASDDDARRWITKLKAVGVPSYVEHRRQANGSIRALLCAGPFANRDAAIAAIAKVRSAGLMANSNGTGSAQ